MNNSWFYLWKECFIWKIKSIIVAYLNNCEIFFLFLWNSSKKFQKLCQKGLIFKWSRYFFGLWHRQKRMQSFCALVFWMKLHLQKIGILYDPKFSPEKYEESFHLPPQLLSKILFLYKNLPESENFGNGILSRLRDQWNENPRLLLMEYHLLLVLSDKYSFINISSIVQGYPLFDFRHKTEICLFKSLN